MTSVQAFIDEHTEHGWKPVTDELLFPFITDTHVEMFCPKCNFTYTVIRTALPLDNPQSELNGNVSG